MVLLTLLRAILSHSSLFKMQPNFARRYVSLLCFLEASDKLHSNLFRGRRTIHHPEQKLQRQYLNQGELDRAMYIRVYGGRQGLCRELGQQSYRKHCIVLESDSADRDLCQAI